MRSTLAASSLLGLATLAAAIVPREVAGKASYAGYRVLRVKSNDFNKDLIKSLDLSTWKTPESTGTIDVVLPPNVKDFDEEDFEVMHKDLGASIDTETNYQAYMGAPNSTWFNSYHAYADHMTWLKDIQAAHPENSELFEVGTTIEKRPITGIHIYGASGKGTKPAVILHGTVHAREWITTMVVEDKVNKLLTGYASDPTIKGYVDNYDFYIIPIVNPDGFVFTQTTNRMWRKNRQVNSGASAICQGRDINRNWNIKWSQTEGASSSPCAEDYKGAAPADAPETKALAAFNDKIGSSPQGIMLYIDYHAYAQLFMTPYGYDCQKVAATNEQLQSLASGASKAIAGVSGTAYGSGPICTTIYQVIADSVDYTYDVSKAKNSFTIELRDKGRYGFVLPPEQILPTATEDWAGFEYLLKNMK